MSSKVEIRTRMGELQKEYSALNNQIKEIEETEKKATLRERYKDYLFKIGAYGWTVDGEEKISEVTDTDREFAATGNSGLAYTDSGHKDSYGYIMLRSKDEYPRIKLLFERLNAAERVRDEKEKDKAKYVKILLGEE